MLYNNTDIYIITLGALKCWSCYYHSNMPEDQQKCSNYAFDCLFGYCYSSAYTTSEGIFVVQRGCDNFDPSHCPNVKQTCETYTRRFNLTSCSGKCCSTSFCNGATGTMTAKFTLCFMMIVGYFFA